MTVLFERGWLTVALAGWLAGESLVPAGAAAFPALQGRTLRSTSGQFVVAGPSSGGGRAAAGETAVEPSGLVDLDPPSLVLTCERIKKALLWELGMGDGWSGRIYVVINPAMTNNQPVAIGAQLFRQGWQYRMEVPPRLQPMRLVRGVAQVLLLELANRRAGLRSAEIPLWLSEGLTLHLARSSLVALAVEPPRDNVNGVMVSTQAWQRRRPDSLSEVRERLQSHAAFSLTRMGELTADGLATETWLTFQASAQLFVQQLLQLPGGRAMLIHMITRLAGYLNWQNAFLAAFQPVFPRLLDAEKWWSVVLIHFTGLDPLNAWAPEVALEKLEDVLHPSVLVSRERNQLPHREKATLQQILREWDYLRQRIVLRSVEHQLIAIRVKMPVEIVNLADQYRAVLSDYLAARDHPATRLSHPGRPPVFPALLVSEAIRTLDQLDERRRALPVATVAERTARIVAPRR